MIRNVKIRLYTLILFYTNMRNIYFNVAYFLSVNTVKFNCLSVSFVSNSNSEVGHSYLSFCAGWLVLLIVTTSLYSRVYHFFFVEAMDWYFFYVFSAMYNKSKTSFSANFWSTISWINNVWSYNICFASIWH